MKSDFRALERRSRSGLIFKRLNLSSEEIENSLRNAAGSLHQSWMRFLAFQAKKPLAVSAMHLPYASQESSKCCLELLWVARFLWKVPCCLPTFLLLFILLGWEWEWKKMRIKILLAGHAFKGV